MKLLATAALAALAPVALAQTTPDDCGSQGNLLFEVISIGNTGTGAGSVVELRVTGEPNEHICLACDTGLGRTDLLGLGTACLDFGSPAFVEFVFQLPPTGVATFQLTLPPNLGSSLICCQALGLSSAFTLEISNAICMGQENCTSGGVHAIGVQTQLENVTFPTTVEIDVVGRAGGGGNPTVSVPYDPASPPSFPINGGNGIAVESIVRFGDSLFVTTSVTANPALQHGAHANRLPNELLFSVSADGDTNANAVHTSCSQPLGIGMVIGDFTITSLDFN